MAGRANRVTEEFSYVLPADRDKPPAEQSKFFFRPLTGHERARVWDEQQWTEERPDGSTRISVRAFQESRRIVFPEQVMKEHPDRVKSEFFRPAQLAVDGSRIEGFGLPHLELVHR